MVNSIVTLEMNIHTRIHPVLYTCYRCAQYAMPTQSCTLDPYWVPGDETCEKCIVCANVQELYAYITYLSCIYSRYCFHTSKLFARPWAIIISRTVNIQISASKSLAIIPYTFALWEERWCTALPVGRTSQVVITWHPQNLRYILDI